MALALAALLFSGAKLRLPPIWLPLGLFLTGTAISLALSPDPAAGLPQIRKFAVFLMLLLMYSAIRDTVTLRRLMLCWAGAATLVALRALVQFQNKLAESRALGQNFYDYYIAERITGFMSHWMTFGGQQMLALLMLGAFLFFAPKIRNYALWLLCGAVLSAALLLGMTRSIWLGVGVGGIYLIWRWKRRLLLALPAVLAVGFFAAPSSVRERSTSILKPRQDVDSNEFRFVLWRAGLRMVEAHPWFGLGPEHVKLQFEDYVAPDTPRPLPSGWYGHMHNIYLHYAAERGLPTMFFLLWLLAKVLWDFLGTIRKLPPGPSDEKFLLHGGVAVVLAIMVAGIFELNLGDSEVLTMFLVTVAAGYSAREAALA